MGSQTSFGRSIVRVF